jgi:glycosyltransferase involved in cell wall biosynthesis
MVSDDSAGMSVSVLIFTKDEEIHLARCLESVALSGDVVVVDSFSTDGTRAIAESMGARFIQHEFTQLGSQITWSLENIPLKNKWALILDADEVVPPELWAEVTRKTEAARPEISAFRLRRRFCWRGRWVPRSSQYPAWLIRLVRVGKVRYCNEGHSETQQVEGSVESLDADLIDENLKGLEAFRARQMKYAAQEAAFELGDARGVECAKLFSADPIVRRGEAKKIMRMLPFRGFIFWMYLYLFRGGMLEGCRGWELCMEKARYQSEIARQKKLLRLNR